VASPARSSAALRDRQWGEDSEKRVAELLGSLEQHSLSIREVTMGRLDGLVAVVTGGGIGRAIALEMAREGAAVVVSSRTRSELDTVVKEIGNLGSSGLAVEADAMVRDRAKDPVRRTVSSA
jgi:shikimate 5-dehydrogenase